MGLEFDPTKYGMKDYAKEFKNECAKRIAYDLGRLDALTGTTVPIGREKETTPTPAENPADEVRSDLGVTLNGKDGAEVKADEVKAEATPAQPAHAEPLTEEQVQERMMFEGNEGTQLTKSRKFTTKQARKDAVADMQKQYMENGLADGTPVTDEKQAHKLAKNYVQNEADLEGFYSTRTYLTKDEYKAANQANKQDKKEYYNDLRTQGIDRREARRKTNEWAEQNLVQNKRLKHKDALKYVEANQEQFYDEDGNFSQVKYKQFSEGLMNTHTQEGEERNGYLSLKERREAAEKLHIDDDAVCDFVRRGGGNFENDYTTLKQIGIIGGGALLCAGLGHLIAPGITVGSGAGASAASAAGGTAAGAGATAGAVAGTEVTIKGLGAAAGVAAGVTTGACLKDKFRDKGGVEPRIYAPAKKEEPVIEQQQEQHEEQQTETPVITTPVVTPTETPCPEYRWESDYCDYQLQKAGENWSNVTAAKVKINGKPAVGGRGSVAEAYWHALKLKHGITDFSKNTGPQIFNQRTYNQLMDLNPEKAEQYKQKCTMRLYTDFADLLADEALVKQHPELLLLKDAEIQINCNDKVVIGNASGKPRIPYTQYNGTPTTPARYKQDCLDNVPVLVK